MYFNATYVNAIANEQRNDLLRRAEIARRNGEFARRTVSPFTVAFRRFQARLAQRRPPQPLTRAYT